MPTRRITAIPDTTHEDRTIFLATTGGPLLSANDPRELYSTYLLCGRRDDPQPSDGEIINELFKGSYTKFLKAQKRLIQLGLLEITEVDGERFITVYTYPFTAKE